MFRKGWTLLIMGAVAAGCGGQPAPESPAGAPAETAPVAAEADPQPIPMRDFAAVAIGPYEVQPMYEEEIEDGHYNINVESGEVAAIRIWVGPEDASGVMVVKTEIENDYYHGHIDVPNPVPDDAVLWIEIEAPDGETYKGSTPLQAAE